MHFFPSPPLDLAFNDTLLEPVRQIWLQLAGQQDPESDYMIFEDREGVGDDDNAYD
jgi:Rab proteins geranylgeranyltransferase component A